MKEVAEKELARLIAKTLKEFQSSNGYVLTYDDKIEVMEGVRLTAPKEAIDG